MSRILSISGISSSRTPTKIARPRRMTFSVSNSTVFSMWRRPRILSCFACDVPGGIVTAQQMRGLASMAEEWGSGRADITTRANLQIREFQPKNIVRVLEKVDALGMTSRGAGADNIRNITASPITGIDPTELYDVAPLAEALHYYILNSRDMYGLPRKFNVAFDNGGAISVVADTNDIGFIATRVGEGHDVPAGVYFRVLLCGITGHKQFADGLRLAAAPGADCSCRSRHDSCVQ